MDGYTYLPTFERISGTQYRITDRLGIGHMLLDEISSLLINAEYSLLPRLTRRLKENAEL